MRKKEDTRALGPYARPNGKYLVVYRGGAVQGGGRRDALFDNYEQAKKRVEAYNLVAQGLTKTTLSKAIELFLKYGKDRGLKPRTLETANQRLTLFFPVDEQKRMVRSVTAASCKSRYQALVSSVSVDTHRNALAEVRRFFRWCIKEKLLGKCPASDVEAMGRKARRKTQLRLTEARRFLSVAQELFTASKLVNPLAALSEYGVRPPAWYHGDGQLPKYRTLVQEGITAALTALLLGMSASEITQRRVRDLDDEGRLLHIEESETSDVKTKNRERVLEVPELLRPYLNGLATGKDSAALLFGEKDRRFVLHWARRISSLAGGPVVTAHGLRGSFASIARAQGAATHLVSAALGHGGEGVTLGHYIEPGSVQKGNTKQVLARLLPPDPKP